MVAVAKIADSGLREVAFLFVGIPGQKVSLAGSFNDWNPETFTMNYSATFHGYCGKIKLPAGNYEYKFVVNGEWVLDEENPNFAANDFGTLNSVLVID